MRGGWAWGARAPGERDRHTHPHPTPPAPQPGPHSRAGRGRAGSHCWSPAAAAGSPSACRCPAATAVPGCAGGCGTSPPGTGPAGAGSGRSGGHRQGWGRWGAGGPTSLGVLPPLPAAGTPGTYPAPCTATHNEYLLCTRPGDTAMTKTDPALTLTESSGGTVNKHIKKMDLSCSKGKNFCSPVSPAHGTTPGTQQMLSNS